MLCCAVLRGVVGAGVIATKVTPGVPGVKPVEIELTDFKTKKVVDTLEVDACLVATGRAPYTNGACKMCCAEGLTLAIDDCSQQPTA